MESRHLDFNLEDLKAEQEGIDKLIDSLISCNPISSTNSLQQRRESDIPNSPAPVRGRGPGRPRGAKTTARTPSSPSPPVAENSSLSAVIQCLNKLNTQNKRLLNIVEVISEKIESAQTPSAVSTQVPTESEGAPADSEILASVSSRLEKIEQNINLNTLVCRGSAVEDLIRETSTGESPNLERLKGEICRTACGEEVTGIDISNVEVSVFGRDKKCIKINCPNSVSKLHLLKKTRTRRPEGFFMSEFLTANKLKIFHNLRALKKQYPQKIKSVFTRGGNILYTLQNSNRLYQVSCLTDLNNILGTGVSVGTSRGSGVPVGTSRGSDVPVASSQGSDVPAEASRGPVVPVEASQAI